MRTKTKLSKTKDENSIVVTEYANKKTDYISSSGDQIKLLKKLTTFTTNNLQGTDKTKIKLEQKNGTIRITLSKKQEPE